MDLKIYGYKYYKQPYEWPVTFSCLWQKRVDSDIVCETNDRLHINIYEFAYHEGKSSFEVEITAERNGLWWKLKCYSLDEKGLEERLSDIEDVLVKMFCSIAVPAIGDQAACGVPRLKGEND